MKKAGSKGMSNMSMWFIVAVTLALLAFFAFVMLTQTGRQVALNMIDTTKSAVTPGALS